MLPIGWGLGLLSPERLRLWLTVALAVAVLVEGARHLSKRARRAFDAIFSPLLRPHEHADLTGATWLAAAMLGALIVFPPPAAVVSLWAVAAGDGAASIVGRLASRRGGAGGKTIAGSAACAIVTMLGAAWLAAATWPAAAAIGAIAAIAERPSGPLDDNLRVAAAAGLAAWGLGVA